MKNISNTKKTLQLYWQHTRPYSKKLYIIYPSMVLAQVVEDFIQPLIISFVLTALAQHSFEHISHAKLGLIMLATLACEAFGHLMWNRVVLPLFWRVQDNILRDLSMTAFDHLQLMSAGFFSDRFAGSLVNQVNKFVSSFERLSDALTWNVFKLIVSLVATTIILAPKAPLLSLAIIVITAIYIPLVWRLRQKQLSYNKDWATAETNRTGQLADTITNILAVKSFAGETIEQQLMQEKADEVHRQSMRTMKISTEHELATGSVQRSINIVVITIALLLAYQGKVGVGLIYLSLTFVVGIMRRLWDLNTTFRTFTRVFGDAYDMTEILQVEPAIKDPEEPERSRIHRGSIEFSKVTFGYSDSKSGDTLFNNLDLKIKPGEKVGLVGHSGGGKTTITKLLLRFMDIQKGSISIDGQDITTISQSDLRRSISYVPQEPMLFHRSLSDNIRYGRQEASDEEVTIMAKMAHAHDFIEKLPKGYKTLVGERGVKLSGGQRQRVAIARAMIKNAPILLLDEATSALDSESEGLIQDALWKLMEGRTAIVIAHRLSTIQKMDRIIVMEDGKISEQGTHRELIRQNGTYASLWKHQSGGFLEE